MRQIRTHSHRRSTRQPNSNSLQIIGSIVLPLALCGCAGHQTSTTSAPKSPPVAQSASKVEQPPSPTLAEVKEAVTRVFKDSATTDPKHEPNFFAADFNGDTSQDIAVILIPAPGKLAELNQEFPPWILKDPFAVPKPGAAPIRVAENDLLLAVIHGFGKNGWRDPQATQTYLLKNVVGIGAKAYSRSEVVSANQGKKVPRLVGDLIGENLRGQSGYLYFDGARYSWYDPKTFTGDVATRLVHPGPMPNKKIDLLHPKLVAAEK